MREGNLRCSQGVGLARANCSPPDGAGPHWPDSTLEMRAFWASEPKASAAKTSIPSSSFAPPSRGDCGEKLQPKAIGFSGRGSPMKNQDNTGEVSSNARRSRSSMARRAGSGSDASIAKNTAICSGSGSRGSA